jgi:hypothetical protein
MLAPILRDQLDNWTDLDAAGFDLALCLGLMPLDQDWGRAKHVFWSANPVGETLVNILDELVALNVLEKRDEPDYQYRWNPNFKGTWE